MKKKLLFSFFCFLAIGFLHAQTTQLFTEDFESVTSSITLNGAGPGTSTGNNQWIVTNNYNGAPTYPNTKREDSTYLGTIAFAPYSHNLHIYDSFSGITSCNYDPTNQSDNFAYTTNGICTLGMDSVHFSFFYLCDGSPTAYGEVWYSINSGPWIQTGQAQYNNKYKWKYEDINDAGFTNKADVRFGFRWVNNNGTPPLSQSFAIDDIDVVGYFSSTGAGAVTITVDSVTPNPVCQSGFVYAHWHLSDTLCDGSYTIQLSTSSGTFPGSNAWVFNINYPQTSGVGAVNLPNSVLPGTCYKIRINRTAPFPLITGIASPCFTISSCPNTTTALQPVVTYDTNAVCIGSVIDIPFWSTGVFTFNTYTAQLSDSTGVFPITPTVIGSMFNSNTYSQSLPPFQPGTISTVVPNVSPGCNYYIRVISSNPVSTVSQWGPFCIGQCDIQTNTNPNLQACVTDCSVSSIGSNTTINIGVHSFNSTAVYNSGNMFTTQLMSSMTFGQIGANGILGSVVATSDTTLSIHIPCKDSLAIYGIPTGMNYLRVVATNSSTPNNALGSLLRLTIGATHATGPAVTTVDYTTFTVEDTFCAGQQVYPFFSPYNYSNNSTYEWSISGFNGGNPFQNSIGANSNNSGYVFNFTAGTYTFKVRETNYGCVGPWGPIHSIDVIGTPSVTITGPSNVCQWDTAQYTATFFANTYYHWTSASAFVVDTSNNVVDFGFPTSGSIPIFVQATNLCASSTATKNVYVHTLPTIPTITSVWDTLTSSSATNNQWYFNGVLIPGATSQTLIDTAHGIYFVVVSNASGCESASLPYMATGINEMNNNTEISVSPNPTNGKFTVTFSQIDRNNVAINIYNLLGEIILSNSVVKVKTEIDISEFANGIYFLEIKTDDSISSGQGKIIRKKFIKE